MQKDEMTRELHPLEVQVLLGCEPGDRIGASDLLDRLSFNEGQSNQAFSWLTAKGLLEECERATKVQYELTELGRDYQKTGNPEERLLELAARAGALTMPQIADRLGLENRDVGSAFGNLAKDGLLVMDSEKKVRLAELAPEAAKLARARIGSLREVLDLIEGQKVVAESALAQSHKNAAAAVSKKRGSS